MWLTFPHSIGYLQAYSSTITNKLDKPTDNRPSTSKNKREPTTFIALKMQLKI